MLIPAAMASFLAVRGHWDQAIALHQTALAAARRADDRPGQARALMLLSDSYITTGDSAAGAAAEQALALFHDLGDRLGLADALNGLGVVHRLAGHYPAAATCYQQALDLFRDLGNQHGQSDALCNLSHLYCLTGNYLAARAYAEQVLELAREACRRRRPSLRTELSRPGAEAHRRLRGRHRQSAAVAELGCDLRDPGIQAWALCELGLLQRLEGDYPGAAISQQRALDLFCDLGDRWGQGHALNALGLIQQLTGDCPAAATCHQQALDLFRGLGDPHSQAEALNGLGELASRTAATGQARDHHGQALAIARDIGAPLEEARALEGIGHSYLFDGDPRQAAVHLRHALAIYERIGAPDTRRVQQTIQNEGEHDRVGSQ